MYGMDSGNGYVCGEDETAAVVAGARDEKASEPSVDNPAPSGASPKNL